MLFNLRMNETERRELVEVVERHGFNSMAGALKWLIRAELDQKPRGQAPADALIGDLPPRSVQARR